METNILPKTWLFESLLITTCCCPPLGIIGIVYAVRVDTLFAAGRVKEAESASNTAKNLMVASICIAIAILLAFILISALNSGTTT